MINKTARNVQAGNAADYIGGYVCAIDVTARNWQAGAKSAGLPWSLSKGCDTFLPISTVVPPEKLTLNKETGIATAHFFLSVNGEQRQSASTADMIFTIPTIIEHITAHVTLEENDLVLTGTPAGVGPIKPGDALHAGIAGLVELQVNAIEKEAGH